ncbi:MAG: hypothetical protein IJ192_01485 [Clostridia bacterium]|nr:hypothetical protein [Clostridia bacterium]
MTKLKKNMLDFMTELRMDDRWNDDLWNRINSGLSEKATEWKLTGSVPKDIVPYIGDLISGLAGGSRFVEEETAMKMEDGEIAILQILYQLYDDEDKTLVD